MSNWLGNVSPLSSKRGENKVLAPGNSISKEERKELKEKDKNT